MAEEVGGLYHSTSKGVLPRNLNQIYNLSRKARQVSPVTSAVHHHDDPYLSLIIMCKEQAKDEATAFVRKVVSAPQPMAICFINEQLQDLVRFCTNKVHFSIFQTDPTFNLGAFCVTTTQYAHLLLQHRRSGKHPMMVGPLFIHQKKTKESYKFFSEHLAISNAGFKELCAIGTDGEDNLSSAFKESCPDAIHLICFKHFKNNITDKLQKIGIDENTRLQIVADIFGDQIGTRFEEGLVDSNDLVEYDTRLASLEETWRRRIGEKGAEFFNWFVR